MVKKLEAEKPLTKAQQAAAKGKPRKPRKPPRERIPTLPATVMDVAELAKPTQRSVAVVNMHLAGAPWHAIAKDLGYASPREAEKAYIAALASMYPVSSWETLRQTEALRAELLLNQSMAMASADYFVDANDPTVRIPNTEKRLWNDQAQKALLLHATITGAKAPARVEVSVDTQELNAMVQTLLQAGAGEEEIVLEASIWDVEEIPQAGDNPVED